MTTSLQKGIEAAKSGLMEEALGHLKDAIVEEPQNANVWVWLSAIIEDEEKQTIFLKKALEIDPQNGPAQRGLAFIERKKYIPPKPGEKLSDYTRPIGVFKTNEAVSPAEAAARVAAESAKPNPPVAPPSQEPLKSSPQLKPPAQYSLSSKGKPWLDIVLYGLTLMVFIVIGILVGTTLLNVDLPFLQQPTPVLAVMPPDEGIYALNDTVYAEMELNLAIPEDNEGIPEISAPKPTIVVNTPLVTVDRVQLLDQNSQPIEFSTTQAENNIKLLTPLEDLSAGRYCLVFNLNAEKNEALYWCLIIK